MEFKRLVDGSRVQIADYVKDYMADEHRPKIKLYVGCDSQNKGDNTIYATTVVLHIGTTGCHVLYRRETFPRMFDFLERLWGEVERSVEVSNMLRDGGLTIKSIDLDFNEDPKYNSNTVLRSAVGYVEASGFKARWKPHDAFSVRVADQICK